jgi:hypothetical protein
MERRVEVISDPDFAGVFAERPRSRRPIRTHQLRDRFSGPSDDDFLTLFNLRDQPRKLRLCLMDVDLDHEGTLANVPD